MRRWFPIMVSVISLGSLFSLAQKPDQPDPFNGFLEGVKRERLDGATVRFAANCNVNLRLAKARYADQPRDQWKTVANLSKGMDAMETDFFGIAAVWKQAGRVVVELWSIEGDVGSEARAFYCFDGDKVTQAENIEWSLPVTDEMEREHPGWGYEQRWTVGADGKYEKTLSRYVSQREQPIPEPKFDKGEGPDRNWTPKVHIIADLELPTDLLK